MKKFNFLLLTTSFLFSGLATSCGPKVYYKEIKKLAPFLYEVTYDGYEKDVNHENAIFKETNEALLGGCSVFRKDNFFARNFDFYFTEAPSFIVKMKKGNRKHASIGTATSVNLTSNMVDDFIRFKTGNHELNIIPDETVDGINDAGVTITMNVCPIDDAGAFPTGTNPGKENLSLLQTVRFILDNADSATNAIELLQNRNLYLVDGYTFNLHFLISDKDKNYIVEVIDNKLVVDEKNGSEKEKFDLPILTNFYTNMTQEQINKSYEKLLPESFKEMLDEDTIEWLEDLFKDNLPENPIYDNCASGVERYEYILDQYDNLIGSSKEETKANILNVLSDLFYSKLYPEDWQEDGPKWASEDFWQIFNITYNNDVDQDYNDLYEGYFWTVFESTRNILDYNKRNEALDYDVWITVHTSLYDIENKTLTIYSQEKINCPHEVNFNGLN